MVREFSLQALLNETFWRGILRAFGGAIVFALPMLMTMEMWWIGFYIRPLPLLLLILLTIPMLMALSRVVGFRKTETVVDDLVDAFVACFVGALASAVILALFSVVAGSMPLQEVIGKIAVQTVPGSIGALLAESQLGDRDDAEGDLHIPGGRYVKELIIMAAGALLLSLNVAPTEEMVLISYMITPERSLLIMLVTLLVMQAFARAATRVDGRMPENGMGALALFLRYTTVAYALALLISLYMLWTFDRTLGQNLEGTLMMTVVLGFPAGVGAAGARLIL